MSARADFTLAIDVAPNGAAVAHVLRAGQEITVDLTDDQRRSVMRDLALPGELSENFARAAREFARAT